MPWLAVSRLSFTSTIKWRQIIYIIKLFIASASVFLALFQPTTHNTATNSLFSYIFSWIKYARMQPILRLCKMRFALAPWALMRYHKTKKFSFRFSRTFPLFSIDIRYEQLQSSRNHMLAKRIRMYFDSPTQRSAYATAERNIHFVEIFFLSSPS